MVEEFLFVPRGSGEDNGWLIGTTLNLKAGASDLHLFDAQKLANGPLANWRARAALSLGFHGAFLPG